MLSFRLARSTGLVRKHHAWHSECGHVRFRTGWSQAGPAIIDVPVFQRGLTVSSRIRERLLIFPIQKEQIRFVEWTDWILLSRRELTRFSEREQIRVRGRRLDSLKKQTKPCGVRGIRRNISESEWETVLQWRQTKIIQSERLDWILTGSKTNPRSQRDQTKSFRGQEGRRWWMHGSCDCILKGWDVQWQMRMSTFLCPSKSVHSPNDLNLCILWKAYLFWRQYLSNLLTTRFSAFFDVFLQFSLVTNPFFPDLHMALLVLSHYHFHVVRFGTALR